MPPTRLPVLRVWGRMAHDSVVMSQIKNCISLIIYCISLIIYIIPVCNNFPLRLITSGSSMHPGCRALG